MSRATAAAQRLMSAEFDIVDDGKWGRYTQRAYEAISPALRLQVDELLSRYETSAAIERARRIERKAEGTQTLQFLGDTSDIKRIVTAVADELGLPRELMLGIAKIESNFNPRASNGSSRGLFQLQPAAWADAKAQLPSLPDYMDGVWDPRTNARAGGTYMKVVMRYLRKAGFDGEITPAVLYLAYQQGAGGFVDLWKASRNSNYKLRYVTPERMTKNPPQDGRGVTTNPAEFYSRWLAVAQKKVASAA